MSKKPKTKHKCDNCAQDATQMYDENKLCDQHYKIKNMQEINKTFES